MASSTQIISKEQLEIQQKYADQVQAYWTARGIQPTAWLDTYGCQQNEADSERMLGMLIEMAIMPSRSRRGPT